MEYKIINGSPLFLHMQHYSTTMRCGFLELSIVRISSKAANQAKQRKPLSMEPYSSKYSKEREYYHGEISIIERYDIKQPSIKRCLTKIVIATRFQYGGIQ